MKFTFNIHGGGVVPESKRITTCREIAKKSSAAGWKVSFMEKKGAGCFTRWFDISGVPHDTPTAGSIEEALLLGCEAVASYL